MKRENCPYPRLKAFTTEEKATPLAHKKYGDAAGYNPIFYCDCGMFHVDLKIALERNKIRNMTL